MDNIVKILKYNHNDIGELFILLCGLFAMWLLCYVSFPLKEKVKIGTWLYVRPFVSKHLNWFFILYSFGIVAFFFEITIYLYWRKFFL